MAKTLGEALRHARVERANLGLRQLAKALDISPTHLSDIENDRRVPSEKVLREIAAELKLDFDALMVQAGRVYDVTERYVAKQPEAVSLFRRVSELGLNANELQQLEKSAKRLRNKRDEKR